MKRVLITGATGFVGKYLIDHLVEIGNSEIFGTSYVDSDLSQFSKQKNVKIKKVDLTSFDQTKNLIDDIKPDQIYHLAALTSPADSFTDGTRVILSNIGIQMNLLNAVRGSKLDKTRVLIVSSGEVYGMVDQSDLPINEETKMRPANPYAVSKIAQDYLALQYHLSYKMNIVRIRPFNHTGPGQTDTFVVPAFARQIAEIEKGQKDPVIKVGSLDAKRDFSDVRDVVRGYVLLMEKGESGEVYNLGSGKSLKIQSILDTLLSFSDIKIIVEKDPARMRPIEVPEIYSNFSKVAKATGWKPEIGIEKTLKDTLDYWRGVV